MYDCNQVMLDNASFLTLSLIVNTYMNLYQTQTMQRY